MKKINVISDYADEQRERQLLARAAVTEMQRHSRAMHVEGFSSAMRHFVSASQLVRGLLLFIQQLRVPQAKLRSENTVKYPKTAATSDVMRPSNGTHDSA